MKLRIIITITGLLIFNITFGQNQEKYREYIKQAWSLYESKEYQKSADKYNEAFNQLDGKASPSDRYNAACSYALAGDIESAFYHLFRLAEDKKNKYKSYNHITTDIDLNIMHNDKRWNELIDIVQSNKVESEKDFDRPLILILDSILIEDQTYRLQLEEVEKKYGRNSEELKAHWAIISEKDSINLIKIEKILAERGWLGKDIIGEEGPLTIFLVIQHSKLETQQKYLPMMRDAVKKGNANASSLAYLEDRVALRQGKRQIYGSQMGRDKDTGKYYVQPLIDPENVDIRRESVGLESLSDYVARYDMKWELKKHIERTKKIEATKEN
tara:strand:- start:152 stop:1135 length:984 start_codon:yes stop_codon:yes gene_type:complete